MKIIGRLGTGKIIRELGDGGCVQRRSGRCILSQFFGKIKHPLVGCLHSNSIRSLLLPGHPMQRQGRHKKEKHQDEAHVEKKHQRQLSKLLLVHFEHGCNPRCPSAPPNVSDDKIEHGERNSDEECAEEKIPEENDLFVIHIMVSVAVTPAAFPSIRL